MTNLSKIQLASAVVAAFGIAAAANAADTTGLGVNEKNAPSEITAKHHGVKIAKKDKAAATTTTSSSDEKATTEKKTEKTEKTAKKGKANSCKGKDGSCKGKDGSCKGGESK